MRIRVFLWVFVLLTIVIWAVLLLLPDGNLHIVACDVGQGDATLIRTSAGKDILIDTGRGEAIIACLGKYLPFYDRRIEVVVLTHGDVDHVGGFDLLLDYYDIDLVVVGETHSDLDDVDEVGKVMVVRAGDRLVVDDMTMDILWPTEETMRTLSILGESTEDNAKSVVIEVKYKKLFGLLTGDVDAEILTEAIGYLQPTDVFFLKVPHHGSRYGLNADVLEKMRPMVSVISVGRNSYGHPHETIIELLKSWGSTLYRTDQNGHIELVSDGERWSVRTEK